MIKHCNKEYPSLKGPGVHELVADPNYEHTQQDIDEVIDVLFEQALKTGQRHSDAMEAAGRGITPYAHMPSTQYTAIQIILELQAKLASAYATIDSLESDDSTSRRW